MSTRSSRVHMRARVIARLALLLIAAAALGSLLALVGVPDRESGTRAVARTRQPAAVNRGGAPGNVPHVFVSVASGAPVMSVPRSFLGLSTEYWAMPLFERHISLFERILSLLHAPGTGPFVLRIGGDSADQAVWDLHLRRMPREIVDLTPSWFAADERTRKGSWGAPDPRSEPRHRPALDGGAMGTSSRNRAAPRKHRRV